MYPMEQDRISSDIQKLDREKLEKLLRSGNKGSCRDVLNSFIYEAGYFRLESIMLRLYIMMDIYVIARTFTKELGISNSEFVSRFGSIDEIEPKLATLHSAAEYFSDMLEQCIKWRTELSRMDTNNAIKRAKDYISENYCNEDISLKNVAVAINLSPTYFSSLFKKDVGTNFVDYLTQVRVDKAKELLCRTTKQVSEIAYEVGFKDYRYFGQIFKKYTGKTPREFQLKSAE